ncbi:MAG: carbohydrate-binding family 9-like protein [bacterium]|nr:carbohydrate-binding family 9-like protein [bacterium]
MRKILMLSVSLLFVGAACAQRVQEQPATVPETVIARATSAIVVDGQGNDDAWKKATKIPFIFPWNDVTKETPQSTMARMLYDDQALYLLYECVDPYLHAEVTEKDGPVWEEDAVEIFVTPNPADITAYFGYEMNANGTFLDYMAFEGGEHSTKSIQFAWESEGMQLQTSWVGTLNDHSDVDKSWILEMAIPMENFRHLGGTIPPQPGDMWRLNLNRTQGYKGQFSIWSDPGTDKASFHHSAFFGKAWFSHKAE